MSWVYLTLMAALMQSVRTAGQKKLAQSLDVVVVTWVRFLFGLPFAILFYIWLVPSHFSLSETTLKFWCYVLIVAISQLLATLFAVQLLGRRNFAIGSTLVKSEAIFTAFLGLILFAEHLSIVAWLAVLLGIIGLFVASMAKFELNWRDLFNNIDSTSAWLGIGGGALFGISSVFIRQSTLTLTDLDSPLVRSVITLCCVLVLQTLLGGLFALSKNPASIKSIAGNLPACTFIGITSMLGSLGWFGAYAFQNAAYVKTLGQIEFLFTLLLTWFYFKEKITSQEYVAMVLIGLSALLIIWS